MKNKRSKSIAGKNLIWKRKKLFWSLKSEFNNHIYNQNAEIFSEKQDLNKNIYDNESAEKLS